MRNYYRTLDTGILLALRSQFSMNLAKAEKNNDPTWIRRDYAMELRAVAGVLSERNVD